MILKKALYVLFASVLLLTIFTGCSSKKEATGQVEAEITFGYDGTVKISNGNPLVAKIKNNGKAFSGELQIEVEESVMSKIIVAQPFEIAENATKEIVMDVPLHIIQKEFKVSVINSSDELLFEENIKTTKILSPERKVMAVITDTPDAYRFLENIKLYMYSPYAEKYAMSTYPAGNSNMEAENIEVLFFDSFDRLDTEEKLGFFNYIYIGHNQSINISDEVEKNLNLWVADGNSIILETGADYKKTNSIMPSSLNPVQISSAEKVDVKDLWYNLTLNKTIDLAKVENKEEGEAITFDNRQVASLTRIEKGSILTLLVNMGQEPIASWNSKAPFLENLIASYAHSNEYVDPYYYSQYQYMAQQVPTEKETPYLFMVITLGLYILISAPILYFILKKMDKRDFAWISIPAMALLCIFVLYLFGSGTRYTKGIMNSISVLTVNAEEESMNVTSDIVIFNNKKGALTIEWDEKEHLKINNDRNDPYYSYNYDPNVNEQPKTLSGKLTLGNPRKFEKYNTSLWSSVYITADKTIPFKADKMVTVELKDNLISITVKNTTPYVLQDAFVKWGQGFIYIGDLEPGEEKTAAEQIDKALYSSFETFIDKKMGLKYFDYSKRPTKEEQNNMRKMELLMQRYVYNAYQMPNQNKKNVLNIEEITLCALNNQDVGYEIVINNEEAERYATNIIEITSKLEFEKGSQVTFPFGIIMPTVNYYLDDQMNTMGGYEYQSYDQYYRFYEQGIVSLKYHVPESISMTEAIVNLGDVYNEQDYYNKTNGQPATPKNVQYQLLNAQTGAWEDVDKAVEISDSKYLDSKGDITLRVDLREGQSSNYSYAQMMKVPSISIEGSVE